MSPRLQLFPPPPQPSPRLRQPLGCRRGLEPAPKGRGEAANKAAETAGTYAPLAPGDGEEEEEEERRRRLPVLARAAGSRLLTSAPASSGDNSESQPESPRLSGSRAASAGSARTPAPWPSLRRWEKPTRGAGEGQAGGGTSPAARPASGDLGREVEGKGLGVGSGLRASSWWKLTRNLRGKLRESLSPPSSASLSGSLFCILYLPWTGTKPLVNLVECTQIRGPQGSTEVGSGVTEQQEAAA